MVKTILILAANPKNTSRLRLEEEVREVDNGLQRSQKRENFILKQVWAVRPSDFRRAILDFKPNIVHFCGHGQGEDGIVLEDGSGNAQLVSSKALAGFFKLFANRIECVLLNACYSEIQANAIAQYIQYVFGMGKSIEDKVAIEFATAFYDALGAGESIDFAYDLACNAIQWTTMSHGSPRIFRSNIIEYLTIHGTPEQNKIDTSTPKRSFSLPDELNILLAELDNFVGLQSAKDFIHNQVDRILFEKRLNRSDKLTESSVNNIIFTGNPGTGKTTIAFLFYRILQCLGIVAKNFHIVSRSDLVGPYVGQSSIKTRGIIEKSIGGILFIDEAYTLNHSNNDFGREAIDTLLAQMELYRNNLTIIISGYFDEMEEFLHKNPGIRARFVNHIHFSDYTVDELILIMEKRIEDDGYILTSDAKAKARRYLEFRKEMQSQAFGNAREVTNLLETVKDRCADRIFRENVAVETQPIVTEEDIPSVNSTYGKLNVNAQQSIGADHARAL